MTFCQSENEHSKAGFTDSNPLGAVHLNSAARAGIKVPFFDEGMGLASDNHSPAAGARAAFDVDSAHNECQDPLSLGMLGDLVSRLGPASIGVEFDALIPSLCKDSADHLHVGLDSALAVDETSLGVLLCADLAGHHD